MKTEREMFEAWAKSRKYVVIGATVDGVFSYLNQKTSIAWESWQASTQRQGYKLVPTEATEIMTNDGCDAISYGRTNEENVKRIYKAMIGDV